MVLLDLIYLLNKLAIQHAFCQRSVSFRFESDCLVIEGIDKTHELVIYSDLTHELKSI